MNSIVNEYESIWNRAHNQKEASNKILAWLLATSDLPPKHTMEAFDIVLKALRPVSREQVERVWKGEWKCRGDCGITECSACGWNIEEYVGDYNFCPVCGAPMTDGAVQMVMERLEALKDVR